MMASMHADAVGRVPWPCERMAAMRWSGGGWEEFLVVARMTARRIEAVLRLVDKVALINEALSLRIPKKSLSFNFLPI